MAMPGDCCCLLIQGRSSEVQELRKTASGLRLADMSHDIMMDIARSRTVVDLTARAPRPSECWLGALARESLSSDLLAATSGPRSRLPSEPFSSSIRLSRRERQHIPSKHAIRHPQQHRAAKGRDETRNAFTKTLWLGVPTAIRAFTYSSSGHEVAPNSRTVKQDHPAVNASGATM